MERISFSTSTKILQDFPERPLSTVDIFIDDGKNKKNLIDIVREIELPQAELEGEPSLAGDYIGLSPREIFLPSKHLLGQPLEELVNRGKTTLLICGGCGEPGCWPMVAKISFDDNKVIWSDFAQIHRLPNSPSVQYDPKYKPWNYQGLKFTFGRTQYEEALKNPLT
jgi:hypothetical protein